jgi:hypothetical protein
LANLVYNRFKAAVGGTTADATATVSWSGDTIKAMLVTSSYTPNVDDDFADTPAAQEISVTGYTPGFAGSGRKTLASKTVTVNDTNDRGDFGAANLTWTALGSGATIAGVVIYKHLTSDALSPLICYLDVTDAATNGGDITISFGGGLVLQLS